MSSLLNIGLTGLSLKLKPKPKEWFKNILSKSNLMAKTCEEIAMYDKECAMVISMLQGKQSRANAQSTDDNGDHATHTHQVPAPQTQMMMQTHSVTLHMWMIW